MTRAGNPRPAPRVGAPSSGAGKLSAKALLTWRFATPADASQLGEWNFGLIRDEGHRNPMTVPELAQRMARWLAGEYEAVVFSAGDSPVGYAVFRPDLESIYLRQFFIVEDKRRHGYGRECIRILREEVWPKNVRLTVDVLCHNTAALAFWRAVGYKDYFLTLEIMPEDNG